MVAGGQSSSILLLSLLSIAIFTASPATCQRALATESGAILSRCAETQRCVSEFIQ